MRAEPILFPCPHDCVVLYVKEAEVHRLKRASEVRMQELKLF